MILFSDFDFTLNPHTDDGTFEQNLAMVDHFRKAGHTFCLTTGRSLGSVNRAWPDYHSYLDYVILDNGAVGVDNKDKMIFERVIAPDFVQKIQDFILSQRQNNEIELVYYYDHDRHRKPDGHITKIRCYVNGKDESLVIYNYINQTFPETLKAYFSSSPQTVSYPWLDQPRTFETFIDIVSVQAGKETAIHTIRNLLPPQKIITVGDGSNDLAMIQEFDGYAMSNSESEVLAVIPNDHIVKTIAELIKKLLAD